MHPEYYAPAQSTSYWIPVQKREPRTCTPSVDFATVFEGSTDLSLAEIINTSLILNPDTKESWSLARMAAASYGKSLRDYFLLTNFTETYQRNRAAQFTGDTRTIQYATNVFTDINFSYLIMDFGQTRATSKAALQALYSADFSHNSEIQTVIESVIDDYYTFLYSKDLLAAGQANIANAATILDAVELKFRSGLADVGDLVQAKTQLLKYQLDVVDLEKEQSIRYSKLLADMGVPSDVGISVQGYPDEITFFTLNDLRKYICMAKKQRPDYLASASTVESKYNKLIAAQRKLFPKVDSEFSVGEGYYGHGNTDGYHFNIFVQLTLPIFEGFWLRNNIKEARADWEYSQAQLQSLELVVTEEVTNSFNNLSYAKQSVEYANSFLESALQDFDIQLSRYSANLATILDVINAQTALADARARLSKAIQTWYISVAEFAFSTGTLTPDVGGNLQNLEPL